MTDPEVKVLMLKGDKGDGLSDDDMQKVKSLIASNVAEAKDSINDSLNEKLASARYVPEIFANADELRSTYPTGKDGIFITADTGHMWLFVNGNWEDAGEYQAVSVNVDKTLSIDGMPADAKKTGDALSKRLSSYDLVYNNDKYPSINNLPWNGAYVVFNNTAGKIPADTPYAVDVDKGALVLAVNTNSVAKTQLWIPLDEEHDIYTRYTIEGVGFSEWKRPLGNALSKRISSYDLVHNNDKYASINSLHWNGAYVVFNNTVGTIPADTPYEVNAAKGALVLTVNTGGIAKTQLWIPLDAEHDIYTRYTQTDGSFTQWVAFGVKQEISELKQKISATNATLHVGEGQKYASLKEALSNAEDGDTIFLHGGTYNPYTEGLTTDGYQINKSLHLKGVNGAKIMASLESPNDDYSPLNLKAPNVDVTVENITIEATNCRYCVHDEQGGGGSQGGYHVYRNCHMINHSLKGVLRLPRCIGSGMCGNEVLVVDSCVFELADSTLSASDFHTDWKVTTDGRQNGDAKVIVKNCVCKTNKICTLSFPGGNRDTGKVYGYFSGNLTKEFPDSNDSELCPATQWNNSIYSE